MKTRQQEKEGFVEQTDKFKPEKIIVKILIVEKVWIVLSKQLSNLKN